MCILSIYRKENSFVLTHNRDEYEKRKSSEKLLTRYIDDKEVTYPVDLQANGTWILTSEKWTTAILNGADKPHVHQPPYKHSRGKFPLKLVEFDSIDEYFDQLELIGIEPFTQIIIENDTFDVYKISWNETDKKLIKIDSPLYVISSSTLYAVDDKKSHKDKFDELKELNPVNLAELHEQLLWVDNPQFPHVKTTSTVQIMQNVKEKYMNFKNYIIRKQYQ